MKIEMDTGVPSGRFLFADYGRDGPDRLDIVEDRTVQVDEPVRSPEKKHTERDNVSNRVQFTVAKLHPSLAAAQLWSLDLGETCPKSGTLVITTDAEGGKSVRFMARAQVVSISRSMTGLTTFQTYTIVGGRILDKQT